MLILGVADNLIRLIAADIGLHQFHVTRSLLASCGLIAFAFVRQTPLHCRHRAAVAWRGVLVGAAMYAYFASLAFLPIGTVVAGLFTAPVFVLLINAIGFHHRIRPRHALAVAIGFVGMVCITLPEHGDLSITHALPVLAGLFYAMANVVAREYCQGESTVVLSLAVFATLGVLGVASLLALATVDIAFTAGTPEFITAAWHPFSARAFGLTALHAACASVAICLLTFAYQHGLSTRVAVLEYALLVFASLFAWLFWAELPPVQAVIGMVLIAVSGIVITRDRT